MLNKGEVAAYVCSHVFEHKRPVLLVARDDGDWQFLCRDSHAPDELPRVIGLNHLVDDDPSLRQVLDLPVDWEAERAFVGGPWTRRTVKD